MPEGHMTEERLQQIEREGWTNGAVCAELVEAVRYFRKANAETNDKLLAAQKFARELDLKHSRLCSMLEFWIDEDMIPESLGEVYRKEFP